jgi:hypothetical protein
MSQPPLAAGTAAAAGSGSVVRLQAAVLVLEPVRGAWPGRVGQDLDTVAERPGRVVPVRVRVSGGAAAGWLSSGPPPGWRGRGC